MRVVIPPLPRPGVRYEQRDETELRRILEQALREISRAMVAPFPITIIADSNNNSVVTAVPAARTEWQSNVRWRTRVDLSDYQTVELITNVVTAGSASAEMRFEYTTDLTGATGWTNLDGSSGPKVTLASTGVKSSGTYILSAAARGVVLIRPTTINGDGATNAAVGVTRLVFR